MLYLLDSHPNVYEYYIHIFIIDRVAYYVCMDMIKTVNVFNSKYRNLYIAICTHHIAVSVYGEDSIIPLNNSHKLIKKLMGHFSMYRFYDRFTQFMRREGYRWCRDQV